MEIFNGTLRKIETSDGQLRYKFRGHGFKAVELEDGRRDCVRCAGRPHDDACSSNRLHSG